MHQTDIDLNKVLTPNVESARIWHTLQEYGTLAKSNPYLRQKLTFYLVGNK